MKTRVEAAADALEGQLARSGVLLSRTDLLEVALVTLMAGDTHLESTLSLEPTTRLLNGLRISEPNVVAPVSVD